jgi:hypothetical protein
MSEYEGTYQFSNVGDRNDVRMRVVEELSLEVPGTGREDLASRYTYYVEEFLDGNWIYLRRPANLHNGFDFLVCAENVNFNSGGRKRNYPKHDDIIFDLVDKKMEDSTKFIGLYKHLREIYLCKSEIDYELLESIDFKTGYSSGLIAASLKWLFIEQDIRYWNYSGRDMLWEGIRSVR